MYVIRSSGVPPDTRPSIVLGLAGMPAAGKSTVAKILKDRFGCNWIRSREIVAKLAQHPDLQQGGVDVFDGEGAEKFCDELFSWVISASINVVDALRPEDHWNRIKRQFGSRAILVGIEAPASLRAARMLEREKRDVFFEREHHVVEREVPRLLEAADYTINSVDDLEYRAELLLLFVFRHIVGSPLSALGSHAFGDANSTSGADYDDRALLRGIIEKRGSH